MRHFELSAGEIEWHRCRIGKILRGGEGSGKEKVAAGENARSALSAWTPEILESRQADESAERNPVTCGAVGGNYAGAQRPECG